MTTFNSKNVKTATLSAIILVGLLIVPIMGNSNVATAAKGGGQFLTSTAPYITVVDPVNDSVRALITSGDTLPTGYTFAQIPDGLGATRNGDGTVDVFSNHELTAAMGFAKVSKLKLKQGTGGIISAGFDIDGSEGYERLCSASLVESFGFQHPTFLTNEEVDDGISLAVDAKTGKITEMPWLGEMAHENTIHVAHFYETIGKTVILTFEDGEPTESEVYMYVADSPDDLLAGNGQLYVFGADVPATYSQWDDIYFSTGAVDGHFIPLTWDHATQDEVDLHNEAIAAGAFQFIRPEDGAMDKREGSENILYMADTGSNVDENGVAIPAGSNGQSWERGRMYKFVFTDPNDPTEATFQVIIDGNDPVAPGSAAIAVALNSMANPDNVDTSQNSLMINEDRIGVNRFGPDAAGDLSRDGKIIRVPLSTIDGGTATLETVAYVNQNADTAAKEGDWESTGILNVSDSFGPGSWLVNVQAHSLSEGGQLLLLKVDGS